RVSSARGYRNGRTLSDLARGLRPGWLKVEDAITMKLYQLVVERICHKAMPDSIGMDDVPGTDLQRLKLMPVIDVRDIKHDKASLARNLVRHRHLARIFPVEARQQWQVEPHWRRAMFPAGSNE